MPSVIVPYSYNYLVNPTHPAFEEAAVHEAETLPVDKRAGGHPGPGGAVAGAGSVVSRDVPPRAVVRPR